MASIQENVTVKIREDGSRVVERNIRGIGQAAEDTGDSLSDLQALLGGLITAATVGMLVSMADELTNVQNRLRLVTTDSANLARVTKELGNIANATRSDFVETANLYTRMANSSKELGLSQQDLLDFTKSVNQAVILSGASAEEAAGGIRQLAQGMASGTLRGDELNSVLENLPTVADTIAKGLGVTRGELRAMGAEGKVTAKDIIDAFKEAKDELEQGFGTTVPTVGQSLTVLKNNFMLFVGELDKTYGITSSFANAILSLANNLDTLLPILAGVATAMGVVFSASLIQKFMVQIRSLWGLLAANPFVALAAVIAGVVTSLYLFRDQIKLGIDETTTLGDLMRAVWEQVGPMIQTVADMAAAFFSWMSGASADTFDSMVNDLVGYEHANESMWLKLSRLVLRTFDAIGGVIRGTMAGGQAVVMTAIATMMQSFNNLGDAARAAFSGDWDGVRDAFARNAAMLSEVGSTAGSNFMKAFDAELASQTTGGLEALLDSSIERAQEIGRDRLAKMQGPGNLAGGGKATIKPPVDEDAMKKAAKELERLKDAFRNLQDSVDPVGEAERRLAEAQDILNKSVKAGLTTNKEASAIYEELEYQLRDQLDPLAALNRAIDENIGLMKMGMDQRDIETQMLQLTQQLRRDGVVLTKEETDALRAKLVVEQELARIAQARDSIERNSSAGQLQEAKATIEAMGQLSDLTGGDKFNVLNSLLGGSLDETRAAFSAQIEQFANYYAIIEEFRQQDVANEAIASQARRAIKQQEMDLYLQRTSDALGAASGLMKSNSKEAFRVGQAAAIGQAIVNTYTGATAAYQSAANIPYVGWILAPIAAAGAIAAGMAQVNAIKSQQMPAYRTGGSYTVGGHGGIDSQTVSLRATPGEKININTPAQARAMEKAGEMSGEAKEKSIRIINVSSVQEARNFANSDENEQIVMNILERNGLFG